MHILAFPDASVDYAGKRKTINLKYDGLTGVRLLVCRFDGQRNIVFKTYFISAGGCPVSLNSEEHKWLNL